MATDEEYREGYKKIKGRWWRTSDPDIPASLRQELVNELMSARRAVGSAKKAGCENTVMEARFRVHNAKCALGERGYKWYLATDTDTDTDTDVGVDTDALRMRIFNTLCALLHHREQGSVCPSEVARIAAGKHWRDYMSVVREAALQLTHHGAADITQKGVSVKSPFTGPVRIRRGPRFLSLTRGLLHKIEKTADTPSK